MPYLDITVPDNFTHLLQLFFTAHPRSQQDNEHMRVKSGLPDAQFISLPMAHDVAAWARKRHLITRAAATRIVEVMEHLASPTPAIADVVPVTPRYLGDPPRRFLTVLESDIARWIDWSATTDPTTEILPLPLAIPLVRRFLDTVNLSRDKRQCAEQLYNWLVYQHQLDAATGTESWEEGAEEL